MRRGKNGLIRINRRYPFLKVVILGVLAVSVIIGMGISSVKGGQVMVKMADAGVDQDYADTFKITLGGEEVDVSGAGELVEDVNKKVNQGEQGKNLEGKQLVALTFDDGPDVKNTEKILNTLKEKNVQATFFMVGIMIERAPEMAKKVAEAGHEVETHSMRHANLSEMDEGEIEADLSAAQKVLKDTTGVEAGILRPPYGMVNDVLKKVVGIPMITWSVDPDDWRDRDAGLIKDRVVDASYDGAIILLHDIYSTTAEAVGWIIDELRGKGFEFVTVKELAKKKGIELVSGNIYRDFANA